MINFIRNNYHFSPNKININKIIFQNCPCYVLPDIIYPLLSILKAGFIIDDNCYLYLTNYLTCLVDWRSENYLIHHQEDTKRTSDSSKDVNYKNFISKEKKKE